MKHKLSSFQTLSIGFALLIVLGALLLMLPIANRGGGSIPLLSALFTATSATCVTGLVVFDTYTQFTLFGQIVIITLIQIGGLGFMAVAVLFSMLVGRRIGLRERSLLMDAVSSLSIGGVVRLTRRALIGTGIFELTGAVLLATRFCPRFGFWTGLWYGLFHSVSAFCNAGFDLMGRVAPSSSLTLFADDAVVNVTIMALIALGGLGFFLWDDVAQKGLHIKKYSLHTKIMLSGTAVLIVVPAVIFYFIEREGAFAGLGAGERVLAAFFQSVTTRTAGFNTVSLPELTDGGALLSIILMVIGAGPGSTGGGVKLTTMLVIVLAAISHATRREDMNIFRKRLEEGTLRSAVSSFGFYLIISLGGIMILCVQGVDIRSAMFEGFSAMSTVGLSMGITANLPALSKIAMILLMYTGRVGTISVAMAMARRHGRRATRNVTEKIIVG